MAVKLHQPIEDLIHHRIGINISGAGRIEPGGVATQRPPVHATKARVAVFPCGRSGHRRWHQEEENEQERQERRGETETR